MNMIRHTTDALWRPIQSANCTAKIGEPTRAPFSRDEWFPVLGGKHQVVEE